MGDNIMPVTINGTSGVVTATSYAGAGGDLTGITTGKIFQVVSTNVSATSSVSVQNGTIVDTPATVAITSSAANSKFLISAAIGGEASTDDHNIGFVLQRVIGGSTSSINVGTAASNRPVSYTHLTLPTKA